MPTETLDALAPYNAVRAIIDELKADNAAKSFDITTKPGEKAARSHIAKLRTVKGDIDRKRKELKADALEYGRKVDGVAKELTAEVESMIEVHQKPLDEVERKAAEVAAAVAAEAARVEAEKQAALQAEVDKLRREAAEREASDRKAHEAAESKARDERLASEAAAKAVEAERKRAADAAMVEAKRKESEAQAALATEREKTAKAQREAEKAKREAAEAENARAREAKAKADADAKRAADKAHRVNIFNEITEALVALGVSPAVAMSVVVQIADGKIPHVSVRF